MSNVSLENLPVTSVLCIIKIINLVIFKDFRYPENVRPTYTWYYIDGIPIPTGIYPWLLPLTFFCGRVSSEVALGLVPRVVDGRDNFAQSEHEVIFVLSLFQRAGRSRPAPLRHPGAQRPARPTPTARAPMPSTWTLATLVMTRRLELPKTQTCTAPVGRQIIQTKRSAVIRVMRQAVLSRWITTD